MNPNTSRAPFLKSPLVAFVLGALIVSAIMAPLLRAARLI